LRLEEISIQKHQDILDVVSSFLAKNELNYSNNLWLKLGNSLCGDGRLYDASNSLKTASSGQLCLSIVLFLAGLFNIFVEEFEVQFG
jgi:hypothetical protein